MRQIRDLTQEALPRVGHVEPPGDLWPRMLRRLDRRRPRVHWIDWVWGALALAWACAFPQIIPALLYQL